MRIQHHLFSEIFWRTNSATTNKKKKNHKWSNILLSINLTINLWWNSLYFALDSLSSYSPWAQNKVVTEAWLIQFKTPPIVWDETEFFGRAMLGAQYFSQHAKEIGCEWSNMKFTWSTTDYIFFLHEPITINCISNYKKRSVLGFIIYAKNGNNTSAPYISTIGKTYFIITKLTVFY